MYDLDNAKIYDGTVHVVARNSASNYTNQAKTLVLKLSYTDTKTSSWMWQASLKFGAKATMGFDLPKIFKGSIEFSGDIQGGRVGRDHDDKHRSGSCTPS
ncbi:hypothetical protein V6N12_061184 [Hibiscus sabdariffa]|uniref:Late embryogenesis abundant protein LEA-2 subgroup domain-containing protein n=1 Tax=Hibiscus sabdariffa TaxID=183260 RepID=A0ABR2DWD0_9ROSI